jgi:hypothetical protein
VSKKTGAAILAKKDRLPGSIESTSPGGETE